MAPVAAVVALGCPRNTVDSEHLLGALGRAGYTLSGDPELADVVIITTCAFLRSAVRESEAAIRGILALKHTRPGMKVVVAGCLVQRERKRLARRFPAVDLFVGVDDIPNIPRLLRTRARSPAVHVPRRLISGASPRLLSTPGHYAYLRIADGCMNHCTYCLIPGIRGRLRSRRVPDILGEARRLAAIGVRELILIAQDTTVYGTDIYTRPALARLLRRLAAIDGIEWLRVMYAHPAHLDDTVIDEFDTNPKLCRYLDLPIQHAADRILRKMNRGHTRARLQRLLDRLHAVPNLHLRTTVIVGFPGETETEFEELLAFIRAAAFDRLGAYPFSREPGTRAARMPGQIPEAVKQERLGRLLRVQACLSRARLRRQIGRTVRVLMDTPTIGRTEWDAPEIDGVARLVEGRARAGEYLAATITRTTTHDIEIRKLERNR